MAKKADDPKSSPASVPTDLISPRKALAMGRNPNTGCGSGPKTKQ